MLSLYRITNTLGINLSALPKAIAQVRPKCLDIFITDPMKATGQNPGNHFQACEGLEGDQDFPYKGKNMLEKPDTPLEWQGWPEVRQEQRVLPDTLISISEISGQRGGLELAQLLTSKGSWSAAQSPFGGQSEFYTMGWYWGQSCPMFSLLTDERTEHTLTTS